MWTAKLMFEGKNALIGSRTFKHKVNLFAFPLSYSYLKKWIIVSVTGILIGEEKSKKRFIIDLKKSDRVINLELNEDFLIATIREPIFSKTIYNKDIIHLSPALLDENGNETINIASFNKKQLVKAVSTLEKTYKTKVYFIEERKIKNISVMRENPELTEKQKKALEIAIKHGYYEYPRQIELEKLARLMNICFSTYQAHLRKAEQKLIPFFFERTK